jgi:hypothetical protein
MDRFLRLPNTDPTGRPHEPQGTAVAQQLRTIKRRTSKAPICPRCLGASFVVCETILIGKTATTEWTCRSCLLTWPEARMAKADVKRKR